MDPATGLSIAKGVFGILSAGSENRAIREAATKSYNANKLFIERDQSVLNENLMFQGDEINNQIGMALTDLGFQGRQQQASIAAKQAETGVFGATNARIRQVAAIKEELTADRIVQQGEAQMTDLQSKLTQVKYDTEAKHAKNAAAFNQAMNQQKSSFEILANAGSAAISGYSQGMDLVSGQAGYNTALETFRWDSFLGGNG